MAFGIILLSVLAIGIAYRVLIFISPPKEGLDAIDKACDYYKSSDPERAKEVSNRMMLAFTNPKSREKQIYHGGCLSCITPETKGIGYCRSCQYFAANWSLKDRRKEK